MKSGKSRIIFFRLHELSHCVKSVQIRSYFWSVFFCIRTEYRKIRTRKNSVFGHFWRSESNCHSKFLHSKKQYLWECEISHNIIISGALQGRTKPEQEIFFGFMFPKYCCKSRNIAHPNTFLRRGNFQRLFRNSSNI